MLPAESSPDPEEEKAEDWLGFSFQTHKRHRVVSPPLRQEKGESGARPGLPCSGTPFTPTEAPGLGKRRRQRQTCRELQPWGVIQTHTMCAARVSPLANASESRGLPDLEVTACGPTVCWALGFEFSMD